MKRLCMVSLALALSAPAYAQGKPNIVLLFADNLGYGELGAYGGGKTRGAPTPRLDALAREGTRLTNFNVEPSCTPSRSALMVGRHPIRDGTYSVPVDGKPYGLVQWEITIPKLLSGAGYATALYGKWHLGDSDGRYPSDQGFDECAGYRQAALLRWGKGRNRLVASPRAGLAQEQSGREFAPTNSTTRAEDAAFQIARISPTILVCSRRRTKHLQRPTPSHTSSG